MEITRKGHQKWVNGKIFDPLQVFSITNLPNDDDILQVVTGSVDVDAEIEMQRRGKESACKVGIVEPCTSQRRLAVATACVDRLKRLGLHPGMLTSNPKATVEFVISDAGKYG